LDFADVKSVMSNAGSALMGIGRASGENRAVLAAQQAIDSPLLEVSIDGARGILFNVIGGNDLSMHEINAAAEAITSAADPDANIIFGATIDDKLSGEIIITVVATGFDASYFGNRRSAEEVAAAPTAVSPELLENDKSVKDSDDLSAVDMTLDDTDAATDFKSDASMPNIWTIADNDDMPAPSSVTQPMTDDVDHHDEVQKEKDPLAAHDEAELEKPSFLRRLTQRRRDNEGDDDSFSM
jgi:cell division protein FtsZ